jgi:hypothetical protein
LPEQRWFPADEALRSTAYEKLVPPLVAKVREEVFEWRNKGYAGASPTSVALLRYWFETEHLVENADGSLSTFRYYFAQREAVETVIWLDEAHHIHDSRMAWFQSIQDIHHKLLQKDRRLALQVDVNRRSITFSPRALVFMNSLDWCPPQIGLIPGAGLYAQAQDFKAPKTASMRELVESIKLDPAGRLQAMLEAGEAKWYSYPSKKDGTSNWGLAIDGRRFSMAGISYALRQLGAPYGVGHKEGRVVATALPKPTRSPVEQQNRAHLAMGVHYGKCSKEEYETYLYDHDLLAGTSVRGRGKPATRGRPQNPPL